MLDGALTVGGPGTEHITWRSPQDLDAERLAEIVAQRSSRIDFAAAEKRLKRIAAELNGLSYGTISRLHF